MPFVVCILLTAITVLTLSWCGPDPCSTRAFALLCFILLSCKLYAYNCAYLYIQYIYIIHLSTHHVFEVTAALFFGQYEARQTEVEGTMKVSTLRESGRKKVAEREHERNVNSAKTRKTSPQKLRKTLFLMSCRPFGICGMTWTIFASTQEQKDFRDLQSRDISVPLFQLLTCSPSFHFSCVWPVFSSTTQYRALSTTQYHCILFFNFPSFQRLHVACSSSVPRLFFVELLVEQTTCKLLSREKIRSKTTEWSNLQTRISRTKRSIVDGGPSQCYEMTQIGSDCIAPIDSSPGRQAIGQQCLNLQRSHR